MSGFLKFVTVLSLGLAMGAGGWAAYVKMQHDKMSNDIHGCRSELAECSRARGAEREDKDKALSAAAATMSATAAELEGLRAARAEDEKRLAVFKSLTEKFRKMIDSGKLQVILRHGRMVVKLPAGVLFASGKAELSKEGKDALREVAAVLRQVTDRRFMVAGHTDNVPLVPPLTFKNNLELSTARALTVAEHLIASGVSATRLTAAGYSEYEPVRENSTEAGRQENRRIEIVLLPNITELPFGTSEGTDAGAPRDAGTTGDASAGHPK